MKPENMTHDQKVKWYAGGKPTAVRIGHFTKSTKEFGFRWLPKLRGKYIRLEGDGYRFPKYHKTEESALKEAKAFHLVMKNKASYL